MRSLQTATTTASNQCNIPTIPTDINADESSASLTPMDTADVSTAMPKLRPKTINNPYSKQRKPSIQDSSTAGKMPDPNKQERTNEPTTSLSSSVQNATTNVSISNEAYLTTTQTAEFEELSQEDIWLVEKAIATQDLQNTWTEVPQKSTKTPQTPTRKATKPKDNNPYSPLRSDD
jgi:hypothetical protein